MIHQATLLQKKKGRCATRLKDLSRNRSGGHKKSIQFDELTGAAIGPNRKRFRSYVGVLGRSKGSILKERWKDVAGDIKDKIWDTIMETFDVPNSKLLKKKWLAYAGVRWRGFKTYLTSKYIFGELSDKSPCAKYKFLDEETWQTFVKSRMELSFQEKRNKAKVLQAKNVYPHRLSRGGYELLEEKMMQEKEQQRREASQLDPSSLVDPPSPPERHEKWKRARQKQSGDYTSEETRVVAEKIESLVEQCSQGTFVPRGRDDILATAIGRPEHPGRVRGVGQGVGIRHYFGRHSRYGPSSGVVTREELAVLTEQLTQKIRHDVMQELASMGFSKQNPTVPPSDSPNGVVDANSAKGSCSVAEQVLEENPIDHIPGRYELYVDNPYRLVAIGSVVNLGPTIHNKILENDMVRVVVEEVRDASAKVPMPTDEVQKVGQALKNFIQWPRRLLQPISNKDTDRSSKDVPPKRSEPQLDSVQELIVLAVSIQQQVRLKLEHDPNLGHFYITPKEIMDLCTGNQMLSISAVQFWFTYLHRQCVERGNRHLYGFIDPQDILTSYSSTENVISTIQQRLRGGEVCYLAPYLDSAMSGYQILKGSSKKPTWHFPNSPMQDGTTECGFYVMRHMLNIVTASITGSWMERFHTTEPFPVEDIYDIQKRWARLFLDLYRSRIVE